VIGEQLALVRIVADAVRRSSPQARRRTQSRRRTGARAGSRTRSSRKMDRQGVVSAPQTHQKRRKRKSGTAAQLQEMSGAAHAMHRKLTHSCSRFGHTKGS
jgi:hypothetical protein